MRRSVVIVQKDTLRRNLTKRRIGQNGFQVHVFEHDEHIFVKPFSGGLGRGRCGEREKESRREQHDVMIGFDIEALEIL